VERPVLMKRLVILLVACSSSPATMSPDGGGGSNSGSNSGSGSADHADLYPLAVGNTWTYNVTIVGAGSTCSPGTFSQSVLSANPAGGRAAYQVSDFCTALAGETYDYSTPGGDEVDFYYGSDWLELIDPTLVDGTSWTYANTSYTWKRETSVTVPAGSYDDCWTANQNVSYTAYSTYCRGAGLVHNYSADLTGAGWDAQLASVQLK
jgi:hypothetical protein